MTKNKKNKTALFISAFFVSLLLFFGYLLFLQKQRGNKEEIFLEENLYEKTTEKNKKLPIFFPSDFPVHPDSTVESVSSVGDESIKGVSVLWVSESKINEVIEFYKNSLEQKGWAYEVMNEGDFDFTFSFEKDVSCQASENCQSNGFVGITQKEDQTYISVTMGVRKR